MQILSIDLGTDLVPALALGAEPPEPGSDGTPPRRLAEHVITRALLLRAYAWLGVIQSLAALAAFYFLYWTHGYWGQWLDLPASGPLYRAATAMTLASVVATQIGNLLAQRTESTSVFRMRWGRNRLVGLGLPPNWCCWPCSSTCQCSSVSLTQRPLPLQNWVFPLCLDAHLAHRR